MVPSPLLPVLGGDGGYESKSNPTNMSVKMSESWRHLLSAPELLFLIDAIPVQDSFTTAVPTPSPAKMDP